MHLSLLSDGYFSDVVDDSGRCADRAVTQAVAHRDGVLRGLAVIAIAGVLLGLTVLPGVSRSAEADDPCRAAEAAVWWEAATPFSRSTERLRSFRTPAQPGTGVSLVALRQRFRSTCR